MTKKKKAKEKEKGLPAIFLERLKMIIPETYWPAVEDSFQKKKFISFRIQKEGLCRADLMENLKAFSIHATPVDWMSDALIIPEAELKLLQETPYYHQGEIYVQSLSSMLVPMILNPQPGDRVLDMTAAPGSKSTQIARMLKGEGHLYANEKIRNRFFKLKANLESQGYQNITVSMQTGEIYGRFHPHFFDKVLLDAPCSSEGRFLADNPKTYLYWKPLKIKEMVSKQRNLIKSAIKTLRPGGTLVYSTCTYAPEENEKIIDWALKQFEGQICVKDFELEIENQMDGLTQWKGKAFSEDVRKTKRILPDETMDAFFIAKIKKMEK